MTGVRTSFHDIISSNPFLSFSGLILYDLSNFNSNPGGYIKRTLTGSIKFILTSVSEETEGGEWTNMCRFYFYELIRSVYLINCLFCKKVKV
jgi:hypothetical protein